MKPTAATPKVILRHCPEYDAQTIRRLVREAMDTLELKPFGRTLVKPNVVSSGPLFEHAHTRAEVVEGVLMAIKDRAGKLDELAVGERCGITIPTRYAFAGAGFDPMLERQGVKRYCSNTKMPRLHIVFGKYAGRIDAKPGEKVVFIGDCAEWKGTIAGESVQIDNVYQARETKNPHEAKHDDIYAKMVTTTAKLAASRGKAVMRMNGCPVSVAEQVLALVSLSGAKNPYFEKSEILKFNKAYLAWRATMAARRLKGQKYQVPGPTRRGDGRPEF